MKAKYDGKKREVKPFKRFKTQAIIANKTLFGYCTEIARLKMSLCEKHCEITSFEREIAPLKTKLTKFNQDKFNVMQKCAGKALKKRVMLKCK